MKIYLKSPEDNRIIEFQNANEIGAGFINWQPATEQEIITFLFEKAKQSKLTEIKVKRDEALNKNITFDGKVYKGTENARTLFFARFNLNKFPLEWRLADDITWVSLDTTKATGLATAFLNDSSSIYQKETTFLISLENAKTIDDVNKIIVNY
jgi:hypothetical protein